MEVIDYIKVGHRNAISRKDLRLLTGLGDRKIRSDIQHLRATLPIINSGAGYYIPNSEDPIDKAEARRYLLTERAKAKEINKGLDTVKRFIDGI